LRDEDCTTIGAGLEMSGVGVAELRVENVALKLTELI